MKKTISLPVCMAKVIILLSCSASLALFSQNVEIKDADNHLLMRFNDEGTDGSIYLPPGLHPTDPSGKIYNIGGAMYWNGYEMSRLLWKPFGLSVYYNTGKVAIGTSNPLADLHVYGINGVLFNGTFGSGTVPVEGAGTRLVWYPGKAAFRVGNVDGTQWDEASIGYNSVAIGQNTIASAQYSMAIGDGAESSGTHSYAFGNDVSSSGNSSLAMGSGTEASGLVSCAIGLGTTSSGDASMAMGFNTVASGDYSMVYGYGLEVSGDNSIGFSLANMSGTNITQANTMAIMGGNVGIGITNPLRQFEVVENEDSYTALIKNLTTTNADGLRIVLQSATPNSNNRYIEFMNNGGSAYIGHISGDGIGGINYVSLSDERLKMNIRDFEGALDDVERMQVKQYEMRSAPGKSQIGLLAQELIEIFPQAVSGDPNGDVDEDPMGIDYGRITPLLVAAIQEQQRLIEDLQVRIEQLEASQTEHGSAGK